MAQRKALSLKTIEDKLKRKGFHVVENDSLKEKVSITYNKKLHFNEKPMQATINEPKLQYKTGRVKK